MKRKLIAWLLAVGVIVAIVAGLVITRDAWGRAVARNLAAAAAWLDPPRGEGKHKHSHMHSEGHGRGAAGSESRIELSEQAQRNIGLATIEMNPTTFARTISVPGVVIEKPGHGDIEVTAPIAGVVSQVYPLRGETIEPGDPLFRLRLTHEEIVQAQAGLLKTTEELDVVAREIARLEKITEGAIEGRRLLEKKYEQQKLEADQRAQTQALVLHGLTEEHVDGILKERRLLKEVLIHSPRDEAKGQADTAEAPENGSRGDATASDQNDGAIRPAAAQTQDPVAASPRGSDAGTARHSDLVPPRARRFFELENLVVEPGQHVDVGKPLCRLGDHTSLYIEGRAFEREAPLVTHAVVEGWKVAASFESGTAKPEVVGDLGIVYLSNAVDLQSRAFHFYVELPNQIVRDARTAEGHRFVTWKYKPGQRVQLHVPVEQWPNRLVVPAEAVVQEGAETYVFQRNGDWFERRTVHVEYQDQRSAVLANDGSVFPGEAIVVTGAYQLHLAIKNKASGGIDPHAGHQH
jgi:multidrug efflux pump subunit AcrA (membrane-fusion protein)